MKTQILILRKFPRSPSFAESPSVLHFQDRKAPCHAIVYHLSLVWESIVVWAERWIWYDTSQHGSHLQNWHQSVPHVPFVPSAIISILPLSCERSSTQGEAILAGLGVPNYFPVTSHPQFSRAVVGIFLNLDHMDHVHMVLLNLPRVQGLLLYGFIQRDISVDWKGHKNWLSTYLIVTDCIQLCPMEDLGHLGNPDVISHRGLFCVPCCSLVLGQPIAKYCFSAHYTKSFLKAAGETC